MIIEERLLQYKFSPRNKNEIMQDTLADEVLEAKCKFEKEWNINGEKVVLSVEVIK